MKILVRLVLVLALVLLLVMAYLVWRDDQERAPASRPGVPQLTAPPAPGGQIGPRYPLPAAPASIPAQPAVDVADPQGPQPAPVAAEPLPPLNESTPALGTALAELFGAGTFALLFNADELARRFVVTIDNLPNPKLPRQQVLAKRVPAPFPVVAEGEGWVIAPDNAARYAPFVQLAAQADVERWVDVYVRYYPLFQAAYVELGNPQGYFNDRLVAVIDHLLMTPRVDGPLRLVRPKVFYEYADPGLEALSAGQKTLLRMGPDNAGVIKDRLQALRAALVKRSSAVTGRQSAPNPTPGE